MEGARNRDGRLAYVAYEFPVLTQTFTRAEVVGLGAAGFDVTVVTCRPAREMAPEGLPPVEVLPSAPVTSLIGWLFRRPLRTTGLLGTVAFARYRDQAWRCRLRGFRQLLQGAALARRIVGTKTHLHAQFVDAASTVAWVAARLTGATFTVTNHTAYNPYLLREKLRDADRFFCISEFDRRITLDMAGVESADNVRVVRQGIDLKRFPFREARPAHRPARLLSVAALREKKGHHHLIRAAGRLRDRGIPFRLDIVGDGPERPRLRAMVAQCDLGEHVRLVGAESPERVRERLAVADVFVLACTKAANGDLDGIPISLMEAMATGVPVVTTRLSGIPELVEDGRNGRLVEPDDPAALAATVAEVLGDPEGAGRRAIEARQTVERHHDVASSVRNLAAEFAEVME